jgi:hypothetical protein
MLNCDGCRIQKKVIGPEREEGARSWRILPNEELNTLYISTDMVRVIKSRRMRRAGHGTSMTEMRTA